MTDASGPVQASERIPTLDIVRGFALLGILIMNMPGFSASFYAEADGSHLWPGMLDQRAEQLRDMLFSGKFNSMFSLLFGIGFTIQLGRMLARDPDHGAALYVRRLLVLMAFAVVHCVLWTGDVLHIYVVLGFLLLVFRGVSNRAVVATIVALICYPAVSGVVRLLVMSAGAVAEALEPLLRDPARRSDLAARGRARAAQFAWAGSAEGHLRAYRAAIRI